MKQDYDVVQLSAAMGTNINLMLIKLNELNRMGWQHRKGLLYSRCCSSNYYPSSSFNPPV